MLGYETKVEHVAIPEQAALILRSLSDLQQFADPEHDAERLGISSATWSLFGHLWPSGRILATYMTSFAIDERRVLELGCGLGLASLVMHRAGVDVTATDIHPTAATFLLANLALNALTPLPFHRSDWSADDAVLGRFELVVGSDVLYERNHASELSDFIDCHTSALAEVIIVDPNRGHRAEFKRLMARHAFGVTVTTAPSSVFEGVAYRGQILRFNRSGQAGPVAAR